MDLKRSVLFYSMCASVEESLLGFLYLFAPRCTSLTPELSPPPPLFELRILAVWVCLFLCLLHSKHQNSHSTVVRTHWGSGAVLAGPHHFKGLLEGQDVALRFRVELGLC